LIDVVLRLAPPVRPHPDRPHESAVVGHPGGTEVQGELAGLPASRDARVAPFQHELPPVWIGHQRVERHAPEAGWTRLRCLRTDAHAEPPPRARAPVATGAVALADGARAPAGRPDDVGRRRDPPAACVPDLDDDLVEDLARRSLLSVALEDPDLPQGSGRRIWVGCGIRFRV